MPSLYAHNKFGKLVIKNFPLNIKKLSEDIQIHSDLDFRALIIYFSTEPFPMNKINQYGVKLHKSDAYTFMLNSIDVVHKYGIHSQNSVISWDLYAILHWTAFVIPMLI